MSVCLAACLSVCLSYCLCLSVSLSVYLSVYLSACLAVSLAASLSVCLTVKCIEDFEVQRTLVGVCKTSSGVTVCYHIGYLSTALMHLLPLYLTFFILPVLKVSPPKNVSDFPPISVTPILSRLCEGYVIKTYLLPAFRKVDITDKFTFPPTDSTTAALVYIMHHVTRLLETNDYVRCLLVDFSTAFDTVSHVLLIRKLQKLDIPSFVINWIIIFLTDRSQTVIIDGKRLFKMSVTRSIVQGSGMGPF